MKTDFSRPYDPKAIEPEIYAEWEKSGFFNPDNLPAAKNAKLKTKNFCVIMPPPNANGALHIGHAVFVTLQDIIIRFERMRGKKTLWLPGADHAGFETQVVFDKKLEKEGRSRFKIPRDELYQEMLAFTLENKKTMENQLRGLGASCDWSREKFTLDKDIIEIVYQTFERLKEDELLYKGQRIVNWCPKHQTSLSEVEVKYTERADPLYYIKYGPLELATVRLETKFGDTAVAVNPKDKRYQKYVGKEIEIETVLGKAKIKVIADEAVDMAFGTGAVKVTPAHDPTDFEIWQRHKDEIPRPKQVIDKFGRMNEFAGPYKGLKTAEAREKMADDMAKKGLLDPRKTDYSYKHNVATCYKCGSVIEPMILDNQWFIKTTRPPKSGGKSLRDAAADAVKSGKIKFVPKRFEKVFNHWMKNLKDWNISRQIVWGIPIPNDPDGQVFDTWFSSGQWPFAALMASSDFEEFYPTDVMETGHDILFFWVARMIMLGLYRAGKIPFKVVYLHGLVRDKDRQKMSKSKGNVIDPLGVASLYGTDAVRMALVIGNTAGNDIIISEEKIRGYRNFANKIWNATRFVLEQAWGSGAKRGKLKFNAKDKIKLQKLKNVVKETTRDLENFRFHHAAERLYHFFWHYYADKVIEEAKTKPNPALLAEFHTTLMKLLHPFMPFITEQVWQELALKNIIGRAGKKFIMMESWPK